MFLLCKLLLEKLMENVSFIAGPPEHGGQMGRHPLPVCPKFSVDVPVFADEPFKRSLFERHNQKIYIWKV